MEGIPACHLRLHLVQHIRCYLVHLQEDTIKYLSQAQRLRNILGPPGVIDGTDDGGW